MNDLFWNKIFAGLLMALIVVKGGSMLSEKIIYSKNIDQSAYVIDTSSLQALSSNDAEDEIVDISSFLLKADVERGEKVFKKCLQCHTPNKGGQHKIGPNLWGIVLNSYAHAKDFAYSKAMETMKEQKWTYENLNQFLYKPKKHMPGTKMSFVGIKDPQERADVILYLRKMGDSEPPLPQAPS